MCLSQPDVSPFHINAIDQRITRYNARVMPAYKSESLREEMRSAYSTEQRR